MSLTYAVNKANKKQFVIEFHFCRSAPLALLGGFLIWFWLSFTSPKFPLGIRYTKNLWKLCIFKVTKKKILFDQ